MKKRFPLFIWLMMLIWACSDVYEEPNNPYDQQDPGGYDKVNRQDKDLDPAGIQAIHRDIFAPTCANSGCHDGTFEPDFRTVESSYQTLLNHPVIKNDELDPLAFRVVPGSADRSMLIRRMEEDLNGNSGIMPLSVDPGSDWNERKEEYILRIRKWIDDGAADQNGNLADEIDFPPQLQGMAAWIGGVQIQRNGFYNPLEVPASSSSLDLWLSISDDRTDASELRNTNINFSLLINQFDSSQSKPLTYRQDVKTATGFYRTDVDYQFHININPSAMGQAGNVFWIRVSMQDNQGKVYGIPNENALFESRKYFAIKLVP